MNFIERVAFRFCYNKTIRKLFRPLYNVTYKKYINYQMAVKNERFIKNGLTVLKTAQKALMEDGIVSWLEFGTLLGAYREHGFIAHDNDLDIAVFFKDITSVEQAMLKGGFEKIREFKVGEDGNKGYEETYRLNDVTIDVFYFHKNGNEIYCNGFEAFKDEHRSMTEYQVREATFPTFNELVEIDFLGIKTYIPDNTEEHLKAHYGSGFMTPDPNFGNKDTKNVRIYSYEERFGIFKNWE